MYLRSLHLRYFRNYVDQAIALSAPKTILVGDNAQGKTNVLEAVELLATLKSHRANRDRELVSDRAEKGAILAEIERLGTSHELAVELRSQGRRTVRADGQVMRRRVDFLGQVNAVSFSSRDLDVVRGGPGERRTWLDGILVQLEPVYADLLDQYKQVLRQRNALIKAWDDSAETANLSAWDSQLVVTGTRVMRRRARLLARLQPLAARWHQQISGDREVLELAYRPQVPLEDVQSDGQTIQTQFWQEIRAKDAAERARGTSLVGPHRDEVHLSINRTPAREYGSQGQQRTLVLALKLAEVELIEQVVGDVPLLLLDDVLAELDLHRQNQLLDAIADKVQTLVTTTHLGTFDARWLDAAQIIRVEAGRLHAAASPSHSHRV
ncbi:MAG: DNA replication/repair protein RecF [Cyanobacteria bacterium P01_E01_bin.48]